MGNIEALNQALFLKINAGPATPAVMINIAIGVANDLILVIPLLLLGMWLWGDDVRRRVALESCLVTFIALGLNQVIGLVWQHPRPFALGLGHAYMPHAPDSSFPSDHMTVFASIGITLLLGRVKRLGTTALLAGLAVAWARIFLGVHFPLDMAGAVVVSGITYAVIAPIWARGGDRVTGIVVPLYRKIFAWPISSGWIRR